MLGAQDRQRPERPAEVAAREGQAGPARDLRGREPQRGRAGLRPLRGEVRAKYDKAADCLAKDREALLAFYAAPAEHWKHVRTTNPIESTFATVRLRTDKTKGCLSRQTALAMVFKLAKSAERHWRRLDGTERLAQVIAGVRFRDGEPVQDTEEQAAA